MVAHLLANLVWVDLDLGTSPNWWAATVARATYCPSIMLEHPKSQSTDPSPPGDGPPCRKMKILYKPLGNLPLSLQNEKVWTKKHLLITDPIERGLRVIEISLLTEQATHVNLV